MRQSEAVHKIEFFLSGAITATAISTGILVGMHAVVVCAICGFVMGASLEVLRRSLIEAEKP